MGWVFTNNLFLAILIAGLWQGDFRAFRVSFLLFPLSFLLFTSQNLKGQSLGVGICSRGIVSEMLMALR